MLMPETMVTYEELTIMRHTVGIQVGRKRTDRNYFCSTTGDPKMMRLVGLGLMTAGHKINDGRDQYFFVSDDGLALLGLSLRAEKKRARKRERTRKGQAG